MPPDSPPRVSEDQTADQPPSDADAGTADGKAADGENNRTGPAATPNSDILHTELQALAAHLNPPGAPKA